MDYRTLGRTDIRVSQICLGTMTWGQQNTQEEAFAQIAYAADQGVTFMDTAELYSIPGRPETQGSTETIIGNWFAVGNPRDAWVLASKVAGPGNSWIRGGEPITPAAIRRALEGNLKRLRTDYIDLYQLHWPNRPHYNFERGWTFCPYGQDKAAVLDNIAAVVACLGDCVREGKVRAIGLSNETSWGTLAYLRAADAAGLPRVATVQNEYNLLRRQHELDMAEVSFFEDVGLLAYSPLAAGALSGKYLDGQCPEGSRGDIGSMWRHNDYSEQPIREYKTLAESHGLDVCQMAIAFCLARPFMTAAIIGATTMDQLRSNIAAKDVALAPEVIAGIDAIHRRYPRPL